LCDDIAPTYYFKYKFATHTNLSTFATHGGLAHLARALAWQALGNPSQRLFEASFALISILVTGNSQDI
jgi:hypothetical protein